MPRTKMVCTLGPATAEPDVIEALVDGGLSMARINMSHGDHDQHRAQIDLVRQAAQRAGRPVAILADLAGPKIRVGDLEAPIELTPDTSVVMAAEGAAQPGDIPTTYAHLADDLKPGDPVLLNDGLLKVETEEVLDGRVRFRVQRGGVLESRKGINMPHTVLQAPSLTEKDLVDLDFALDVGVEYVGLSFVRKPDDVRELKERTDGRTLVVAKIEMAKAVEALEEILEEADAVMVARGDLGVELPFEQVPLVQKRIIQLANFHSRPVITATQMLESMIENPRPTRAEASDVANAILDGTDAVMLSGETAIGRYPLRALEAMMSIATEIEHSGVLQEGPLYDTRALQAKRSGASAREHAVASATVESARQLDAVAIIVITRSGGSARLVSSYRPPLPIFAICTDPFRYNQLNAVWGVRATLAKEEEISYESLTNYGRRAVLEAGLGKAGDSVVVTAGFPFHTSGSTNTMRVEML
ncbi:MAG: pyruvate kinase [Longimicrobiales bacterium]